MSDKNELLKMPPANETHQDTLEDIVQWFRDNNWLLALHSENSMQNRRFIAYLYIHPAGIYAHGSGYSDLTALQQAQGEAKSRMQRVVKLLANY